MTRYYMRTWGGLGDNIYLRPAVRGLTELGDVWLETPWPELFEDLPVHFVEPRIADRTYPTLDLRHARRNANTQHPKRWATLPPDAVEVRPYVRCDAANLPDGVVQLRRHKRNAAPLPTGPWTFDLPDFGPPPVSGDYAFVRPVVTRSEWKNTARNPLPEYVATAAVLAGLKGLDIVTAADFKAGEEWADYPLPIADTAYNHGELSLRSLLALIQHARVVIGPVGFILPAALAMGTPLLLIGGGHGRTECPEWLTAPWMDTSRLRWLQPDPFCKCSNPAHDCPKEIPDFHTLATEALQELLP